MTPEYSAEEREQRAALLIEVGKQVEAYVRERHDKTFLGRGGKIANGQDEIIFVEGKIAALVDQYFDLLGRYKERYDYKSRARLANRDKMAAFSAIAILDVLPFVSRTRRISTEWAELANEMYAYRFCALVLKVDHDKVPEKLRYWMLLNLRGLKRHMFKEDVRSDECLVDWMIVALRSGPCTTGTSTPASTNDPADHRFSSRSFA